MQHDVHIEVTSRDTRGKNAARRLRVTGKVPAVVYGGGKDPVAIEVERKTLDEFLRKSGNEHAVFLLDLAGTGKSRHAMIRERQIDALTGETVHVDFLRVAMDKKLKVDVSIEVSGESYGVKTEGGVLDFVTRHVMIEALPGKIPGHLTVDVSGLHVGQHLEAKDIPLPDGVALVTEPERVIVSVAHVRAAAVATEAEEGLIEAARAEPEVIGRASKESASE
jgi:large subunit ribosomal protein L25